MNNCISITEARKILGEEYKNLSDIEISKILAKLRYLAEEWIDAYEKSIFKGKTINEILSKLEYHE